MIFSIQFRICGATQYTLDLDIRKRNQVILLVRIEMEDRMANLLDVHAPIEADLLACVAFRPDTSLIIP